MGRRHERRPVCPDCQSNRVRRSHLLIKDIYRRIVGSKTYYCADCGCRWSGERRRRNRLRAVMLMVAMSLCSIAMVFLLTGLLSSSPKRWFKSRIIDVYQIVYGAEHRQKLHEHLGGFYGGLGEELDDYASHTNE